MKIYRATDGFGVTGIDFCCGAMAEDILFGKVTTTHWTDHPLCFEVKGYKLSHCGHCGAKIEGEIYRESDKIKGINL